MRISQAASRVGISADYLRRLERNGRIPIARRIGSGKHKQRIYLEEDISAIQYALYGVKNDSCPHCSGTPRR